MSEFKRLEPCPFCGGEAELFYGPGLGTASCRGYTLYAGCNECGAKSPGLWQEKKPEPDDQLWKDAADEWNNRPGDDEARAEIERKSALIEQMKEALRFVADEYSLHVSRYENRNAHDDQCYIVAENALAAERGEG